MIKNLLLVVLTGLLLVAAPWDLRADNLSILVSDGTSTFICADGSGCDTNLLPGAVTFTNIFGSVSVGGTASGSPALTLLHTDLSYNLTAGLGSPAKTYTVELSENNLHGINISWNGQIGGTQYPGDSITAQAWAGGSNTLFNMSNSICGPVTSSASPFALTCSGSTGVGPTALFALTERALISVAAGSNNSSGDFTVNGATVPEPSTLVLLGIGLVGLGIAKRRNL